MQSALTQDATLRLMVTSVGRAGAAERAALAKLLGQPQEALTAQLLRAPTLLTKLDDAGTAHKLLELLRTAGACAELVGPEVTLPTPGELDISVTCADARQVGALVAVLSRFLGTTPPLTTSLLLRTPPVVLGRVSAATAEAIGAIVAPVGGRVAAAHPEDGRYDARVRFTPTRGVELLRAALPELRWSAASRNGERTTTDLDYTLARRLWDESARLGLNPELVDQRFHRYDLVLHSRGDETLPAFLAERFGVPIAVAPRMLARLPLVLASGLSGEEARAAIDGLRDRGAQALASCLSFACFDVHIEELRELQLVAQIATGIGALGDRDVERELRADPTRLRGPFNDLCARWICAELRALGCKANRVQVQP